MTAKPRKKPVSLRDITAEEYRRTIRWMMQEMRMRINGPAVDKTTLKQWEYAKTLLGEVLERSKWRAEERMAKEEQE